MICTGLEFNPTIRGIKIEVKQKKLDMRRKPQPATTVRVSRFLKQLKTNGILPYKERPAVQSTDKEKTGEKLGASDLFSIFTADIIKEDVVFTR